MKKMKPLKDMSGNVSVYKSRMLPGLVIRQQGSSEVDVIVVSRRTARLLAKRILKVLEETK